MIQLICSSQIILINRHIELGFIPKFYQMFFCTYVCLQSGEFEWDKTTQSMILSGYYYGYIISQILGGWLSGRFGGKVTIGVFMSIVSIFNLLTPYLARQSAFAVVVTRAIMGVATVCHMLFIYM